MVPTPSGRVVAGLLLGLLSLPACGGGGGGGGSSSGGLALLEIRWGRIAAIRDVNQALVAREKVVEEGIQSDLLSYEVTTNSITGTTTVRILLLQGTPQFDAAYAALDDQLGFVVPKSVNSPPPYSMVPRNAVALLRFNQPVKASSLTPQTIRVFEGVPAEQQLEVLTRLDPSDSRNVIVEPTVSALQSELTGLAVNAFGFPPALTTVTPNLQIRIPTKKDPQLGQTTLLRGASGSFPEDDNPSDGPDVVRTLRSGGSTAATGDPNNGFVLDLVPPTLVGVQGITICEVSPVSELRRQVSLGFSNAACAFVPEIGDVLKRGASLGLVVGLTGAISPCAPPSVPGQQVLVELITFDAEGVPIEMDTGPAEYNLAFKPVDEEKVGCFVTFVPEPGSPGGTSPGGIDPVAVVRVRFSEPMDPDTVRPYDTLTLTLADPTAPPNTSVDDLAPNAFVVGELAASGDLREYTFVPSLPIPHLSGASESRFLTLRTGNSGVRDLSGNPLTVPAFHLPFTLSPTAPAAPTGGFVLRFTRLNETSYDLGLPDLGSGPDPIGTGKSDYGGQIVLDEVKGELRGRPAGRFSKVADFGNPFVGGAPVQLPNPVLTPLTSFGSRLQTLLRHVDVGLSGSEVNEMNLDVEGLNWAPFGGTVAADALPRFRIDLAHSHYFPDEVIDITSLLPVWPLSGLDCNKFYPTTAGQPTAANPAGLTGTGIGNPFYFWYWNNETNSVVSTPPGPGESMRLGFSGAPLTVTDTFPNPYVINPLNLFLVPGTFTPMVPFPAFTQTYTWRDTGIPFGRKGGPSNGGVEPEKWSQVLPTAPPQLYPSGIVPSVCLPLLIQCKSYPPTGEDTTININGLQVSLMVNTSAQPNFRVFTTGGVNSQNVVVYRNPDTGNTPLGGFNPTSTPPGLPTQFACGPELYWSQVDFVVRVTRAFTHWFDLGASTTPGAPIFSTPVVEPRGSDQPAGTTMLVEFRGASTATGVCAPPTPGATCLPLTDATIQPGLNVPNVYGIYISGGTTGFPNQAPSSLLTGVVPPFATALSVQASVLPEFTPDITRLNGKRYLQLRFTFLSNIVTGEVPTVSSVGVAYVR